MDFIQILSSKIFICSLYDKKTKTKLKFPYNFSRKIVCIGKVEHGPWYYPVWSS